MKRFRLGLLITALALLGSAECARAGSLELPEPTLYQMMPTATCATHYVDPWAPGYYWDQATLLTP